MCYYFAKILDIRFCACDGKIVYDPVINHFGYKIKDNIYDITGEVSDKYDWQLWDKYKYFDTLETSRIVRDCIQKKR